MNTEPADMDRPFQVIGTGDLRPFSERGPEVNRDAGDERHGDGAGKGHHDAAHDATRPLCQRVVEKGENRAVIQNSKFKMQSGKTLLNFAFCILNYSRITSIAPASTDDPSVTRTSLTVPAARARSSFSIFIA